MKAREFTNHLNERVKYHDIYIWGGQGEKIDNLPVGSIIRAETSNKNAARVLEHIAQCLRNGYDISKIEAKDCSGLGVKFFIDHGIINHDTTADGLYNMCSQIKLSETREGDMVFISNNKGVKTHVGYVIDKGYVVESAGRDFGVIKRNQIEGSPCGTWTHAARPGWWEKEQTPELVLCRVLKLTNPRMQGDDVETVQVRLTELGYDTRGVDGVYGPGTCKAVETLQGNMGLEVDGKVGPQTAKLLGITYKG